MVVFSKVLLLFTLSLYALLFTFFYINYKKLLFEISLIPIPTPFKKVQEKHSLIRTSFPLIENLKSNVKYRRTVVLITSNTCSNCDNSFAEIIQILRNNEVNFVHIITGNVAYRKREKYISDIDCTYQEINILDEELKKYDLTVVPTFILISDDRVIEVTSLAYRIEYLLETSKINCGRKK